MSLFSDMNTRDVGRTREKVENHELIGEWVSTISSVFPTPQVFISEDRDMVNVFYFFYKITTPESIQTLFIANDWVTESPNCHQNARSTNKIARKIIEHHSRWNVVWMNETDNWKSSENSQGICFNERNFQKKKSNWCWTAVLFVAYSSKQTRMFLSIEFRIVHTANILPSSTILLLHLEVLFVWFIWAVNLVCLTTLLSLDGLFAVYLLSSSATEKKYRCTGRDRLSGCLLW